MTEKVQLGPCWVANRNSSCRIPSSYFSFQGQTLYKVGFESIVLTRFSSACPKEFFNVSWSGTFEGEFATQKCPRGAAGESNSGKISGIIQKASREYYKDTLFNQSVLLPKKSGLPWIRFRRESHTTLTDMLFDDLKIVTLWWTRGYTVQNISQVIPTWITRSYASHIHELKSRTSLFKQTLLSMEKFPYAWPEGVSWVKVSL